MNKRKNLTEGKEVVPSTNINQAVALQTKSYPDSIKHLDKDIQKNVAMYGLDKVALQYKHIANTFVYRFVWYYFSLGDNLSHSYKEFIKNCGNNAICSSGMYGQVRSIKRMLNALKEEKCYCEEIEFLPFGTLRDFASESVKNAEFIGDKDFLLESLKNKVTELKNPTPKQKRKALSKVTEPYSCTELNAEKDTSLATYESKTTVLNGCFTEDFEVVDDDDGQVRQLGEQDAHEGSIEPPKVESEDNTNSIILRLNADGKIEPGTENEIIGCVCKALTLLLEKYDRTSEGKDKSNAYSKLEGIAKELRKFQGASYDNLIFKKWRAK